MVTIVGSGVLGKETAQLVNCTGSEIGEG